MKQIQINKAQADLLLMGISVYNCAVEARFVWWNNRWWHLIQTGPDEFYLTTDLEDFPPHFGKQILVLEEVLELLHLRLNQQDFLIIKPELEKLAQQSF